MLSDLLNHKKSHFMWTKNYFFQEIKYFQIKKKKKKKKKEKSSLSTGAGE